MFGAGFIEAGFLNYLDTFASKISKTWNRCFNIFHMVLLSIVVQVTN